MPGAIPRRGDVALYHPFAHDRTFFIDRVVGLPGDRVQMDEGRLRLNGRRGQAGAGFGQADRGGAGRRATAMSRRCRTAFATRSSISTRKGFSTTRRSSRCRRGITSSSANNRDNATDSRVAKVGFVPRERFIGRVARRLFSVNPENSEWRGYRFLQPVR